MKKILKVIVPVVIIIIAVFAMKALKAGRSAPEKKERVATGTLVRLLEVNKVDYPVKVKGTGVVGAARELALVSQVSGLVKELAPNLVAGGFFKEGELLFSIEADDFKLAIEGAEAAVVKAEYNLALMESEALVARGEWEVLYKDSPDVEPDPLVLKVPQMKNAEAALKAASAELALARLSFKRTNVFAPFDCRVRSEELEVGIFVRSGITVAVLAGTERAEVDIALPIEELKWIDVPKRVGRPGAKVLVRLKGGNKTAQGEGHFAGQVVRSTGEISKADRMAHIIVSVNDPYAIKETEESGGEMVLAEGAFVEVEIEGTVIKDTFTIPRTALRDGDTVWVMDAQKKLRIKKVEIKRIEYETVIIKTGLNDGDIIVLTNISGAAEGKLLKPVKKGKETR